LGTGVYPALLTARTVGSSRLGDRAGQRKARKSAKTTLDTYGHIWPDRDESTRAAVDAVIAARTEQR